MRSHTDDRGAEPATRTAADRPRSRLAPNANRVLAASPGSERLTAMAAVTANGPVQRKQVPAPSADDPGRFYDDQLAQYVHVLQPLAGIRGQQWLLLEDLTAHRDQWIYEPAYEGIPEHYTRFAGLKSYENRLRVAEAERAEHRYRDLQQTEGFSYRVAEAGRKDIESALDEGVKAEWNRLDRTIAERAKFTFLALKKEFAREEIEPSPELLKKINDAVYPLRKPKLDKDDPKRISEALSELQYAAHILGTTPLKYPLVVGAKGPEWSPGMEADIERETRHGRLPALDVIQLEVDAYYFSSDGVLHVDEVKDTPRAFADKAKSGDQIRRQVQWLTLPVFPPDSSRELTKEVGYYVQASGPAFDAVLEETVIQNLKLIDRAQRRGRPFILVDRAALSVDQLESIYNRAITWLEESTPFFAANPMSMTEKARRYFNSLELTLETLAKPPKKPGDPL